MSDMELPSVGLYASCIEHTSMSILMLKVKDRFLLMIIFMFPNLILLKENYPC